MLTLPQEGSRPMGQALGGENRAEDCVESYLQPACPSGLNGQRYWRSVKASVELAVTDFDPPSGRCRDPSVAHQVRDPN